MCATHRRMMCVPKSHGCAGGASQPFDRRLWASNRRGGSATRIRRAAAAALRVDETPRIIDVIDGQFSIQTRFSLSERGGAGHKFNHYMVLALATVVLALATPGGFGTRTIGVDFGLRRVGIAISSGIAPLPLTVLRCASEDATEFERVAKVIATYAAGEGATQIVLGMPYNSTGGEGEQAAITRAFALKLADAVSPKPVYLWDERFSSAEASMRMNGGVGAASGEALDAVAAAVILEDFFGADSDALKRAPCVLSTRPPPAARPRGPPPPAPPSQAEVRKRMMERVAQHQLDQKRSPLRSAVQQPRRGPELASICDVQTSAPLSRPDLSERVVEE